MAFDFNSLSKTPISQKDVLSARTGATSSFSFDALPKSPIELAASKLYQYGSITPESVGLGPVAPKVPQTGWGLSLNVGNKPKTGTANTTPQIAEQTPTPKSYLEGIADIVNGAVTAERENVEKYKNGDIGAAERYTGSAANVTSVAVAPLMELFNQIPVVGGVMKVMGEGLTYGPKGAGEALSNVPGYKQILENNPWITDYSEAVSPTVENATVTALNLATLLGTVESGIKTGVRGKAALEYRVTKDADSKLVTRNGDGDVVYIEDKNGVPTYGEKPADYPLIRLNSALQDLKKSSGEAIENKKVTDNATSIKEVITGTKSGQNWWAQNPESEAASQRVAGKVDLSDSVDTTGTVNTKPHQDYFKETYLAKKEDAGYKLLEKEDASVNIEQIINKLEEEFSNTNLPRSIVEKAISNAVKKVLTTADELGNIKLVELAKEKSAAQRSANYERTQNNSNAEIKNKTVGRALRLVVEDVSKTDVAKVNGELSKLYQELGILERLDGMKVSGGKLGKYFAQISGNIIGGLAGGAIGGPIGAAGAAVVGGELSSALRGKIMAGKFKKTIPSGETSATLTKAITDTKKTTKVNLKTPDKKVGAPKSIKKTKEIVKIEAKIAKNVEAQKVAIKAKDYTLVAKLKQAYTMLVEELKKAIKYLNENGSVGMSIKDVSGGKATTPEGIARMNKNYTKGPDGKFTGSKTNEGQIKNLTTEQKKTLVAVHNLTSEKLAKADKLGGLANPSVAVFNPEKFQFENFGDITMVASKDFVFSPKARTFAADVYSPRFPNMQTDVPNYKQIKAVEKEMGIDLGKIDTSDFFQSAKYDDELLGSFLTNRGMGAQEARYSQLTPELKNAYGDYVNKIAEKVGVTEVIFDGFTNSGRRKYVKNLDVDKISKLMNKEALRSGENFHYGLGSIRAKLAPEFRNVTALKSGEKRLVSKEDFESIKNEYDSKLYELSNQLDQHLKSKNSESSELLGEYLSGDKTILKDFFNEIPPELKAKIDEFGRLLYEMPTEYFETKFKRPVNINEFSHAVIPDTTPQSVIKILEDKGIQTVKYKEGTGNQAEALKKLVREKGLLFGLGALVIVSES